MCRFIETVCVEDGAARNLPYHNARLNATRRHFFGDVPEIDLSSFIGAEGRTGRVRCRVTYGERIAGVEYFPYRVRPVNRLMLVECGGMDYRYKYADRSVFEPLLAQRGVADDVLIVRDGLLTDTSFTNVALWNGTDWLTPARPLLEGTKRRYLLDRGILTAADIPVSEVANFRCICLFNAMLRFGEVVLPCECIIR